jgi:phage terminase large subunit-like protein
MKARRPEKAHLWSLTIDIRTPYMNEEQTLLLAPELYTFEHFEAMKAENIRTFYSEMMQDPRARIGGMWEASDIHYINSWMNFKYYDRCCIAVDFAWTEKETSDYTAIITILRVEASMVGELGFKYLVIWEIIRRMPVRTVLDHNTEEEKEGILESIQRTFVMANSYFPEQYISIFVAVEMNGGGKIIVDQARREMDVFTFAEYIVEVDHRKDKEKRIEAEIEQPVKNGTVRFLKPLKEGMLIDQMLVFPNGKHDDGPDTLGMGKNELNKAGISISEINRATQILKERREAKIMGSNINAMDLKQTLEYKYNRKKRSMF